MARTVCKRPRQRAQGTFVARSPQIDVDADSCPVKNIRRTLSLDPRDREELIRSRPQLLPVSPLIIRDGPRIRRNHIQVPHRYAARCDLLLPLTQKRGPHSSLPESGRHPKVPTSPPAATSPGDSPAAGPDRVRTRPSVTLRPLPGSAQRPASGQATRPRRCPPHIRAVPGANARNPRAKV